MRLIDFAELCRGYNIEVRSGYNDRLLTKAFRADKHVDMGEREVVSCWPEVRAQLGFARAVMCVYVSGEKELEEEMRKQHAAD